MTSPCPIHDLGTPMTPCHETTPGPRTGEVGQKNSRERYALVVEGHADLYLRRPTRNNCYFDMPKKKSDRDKENADKNKDKEVCTASPCAWCAPLTLALQGHAASRTSCSTEHPRKESQY